MCARVRVLATVLSRAALCLGPPVGLPQSSIFAVFHSFPIHQKKKLMQFGIDAVWLGTLETALGLWDHIGTDLWSLQFCFPSIYTEVTLLTRRGWVNVCGCQTLQGDVDPAMRAVPVDWRTSICRMCWVGMEWFWSTLGVLPSLGYACHVHTCAGRDG